MRLFISWSGGRSHRLAVVLKEWLETHFSGHGISAFVSSRSKRAACGCPRSTPSCSRLTLGLFA